MLALKRIWSSISIRENYALNVLKHFIIHFCLFLLYILAIFFSKIKDYRRKRINLNFSYIDYFILLA